MMLFYQNKIQKSKEIANISYSSIDFSADTEKLANLVSSHISRDVPLLQFGLSLPAQTKLRKQTMRERKKKCFINMPEPLIQTASASLEVKDSSFCGLCEKSHLSLFAKGK